MESLTAAPERRLLLALAALVPARIGPDHLTALGLAGMALAGLAYAFSGRWPALLLAANVALAVNWLGDSLDGTLARYRRRERPRYGFYVDHMVDAFGALCLLVGLAASGWITPALALALLLAYFLLSLVAAVQPNSPAVAAVQYNPASLEREVCWNWSARSPSHGRTWPPTRQGIRRWPRPWPSPIAASRNCWRAEGRSRWASHATASSTARRS